MGRRKSNDKEAEVQDQLDELMRKRTILNDQLTRLYNLVTDFSVDNIGKIEARLEKCNEWWNEFLEIQFEIERYSSSLAQQQKRIAFEDHYFEVVSIAKDIISQNEQAYQITTRSQGGPSRETVAEMQLAPIEVPKFDGSYNKWLSFWDAFRTLIDSNNRISQYQKFVYLQRALTGAAAELIEDMEITEGNYKDAIDLLKLEFDNKKIITYAHLEALDSFPTIGKESYEQLNKFLNTIRKNIRALTTLGQNVEQWETYMIFHLHKKLDQTTKNMWKQKTESDEFPSMEKFLNFLSNRCKYLEPEKTGINKQEFNKTSYASGINKQGSFSHNNIRGNVGKFQSQPGKTLLATQNQKSAGKCGICNESHNIFLCKKFLGMTLGERRNQASEASLCWNCLKRGHRVQDCSSGGCKHCGRRHHSLLHEDQHAFENINGRQKSYSNVVVQGEGLTTDGNSNPGTRSNQGCNSQTNLHEGNGTQMQAIPGGSIQSNEVQLKNKQSQGNQVHTYCVNSGIQEVQLLGTQGINQSNIFLSTAILTVEDCYGTSHSCRCLLDSGSQSSFITKQFWEKLGIPSKRTNLTIVGMGQTSMNIDQYITTKLKSRCSEFEFTTQLLVIDEISENIPSFQVNRSSLQIPSDKVLADVDFAIPRKIDILLGAGWFLGGFT